MIGSLIFLLFLLVAGAYALANKPFTDAIETRPNQFGRNEQMRVRVWHTRYFLVIGGLLLGGLVAAIVQPYRVEKIDPGFVGLQVNLIGDERGISKYQYKTGWVVYNAYTEQVVEIPSSQQHVEYEATGIAKGGFSVSIAPSFNYEIVPENAGDMYVSLRRTLPQIEQTWLKTASIGATNDVINRWSVDSIFNHRAEFEGEVIREVDKRVQQWFRPSQIRTNITPPASLQKAIAEKTAAVQEAQAAQAQNAVIHMDNLNKIMAARGDSAQKVIAAAGEAKAIAIRKQEITALYIDYLRIQAWDGHNPTTLVTDGSSTTVMVK